MFENFTGSDGCLPAELTSAIEKMCKEKNFQFAQDGDSHESWIDITHQGIRTTIMVLDAKDGPIKVSAQLGRTIPAEVETALLEVHSELLEAAPSSGISMRR